MCAPRAAGVSSKHPPTRLTMAAVRHSTLVVVPHYLLPLPRRPANEHIRVAVVGPAQCGKSSLIARCTTVALEEGVSDSQAPEEAPSVVCVPPTREVMLMHESRTRLAALVWGGMVLYTSHPSALVTYSPGMPDGAQPFAWGNRADGSCTRTHSIAALYPAPRC